MPPLPGPRRRTRWTPPGRLRGSVKVGDLFMSAAQVRAELDRVDRRYQSLLRAAAALPDDDATRVAFRAAFRAWRAFYEDARNDWLAWGSNVSEADRFDREADAWRARLAEAGAPAPDDPTTSRTAPRTEVPGASWWLAAGVLVVVGVYLWRHESGGEG